MKYVILSSLLLAPLQAAQAGDLVALDTAQREAFGIETAATEAIGAADSRPYPARIEVPNAQLRVVGAPLDGVVESLLVAEGESVRVGQALARIRSPRLLELQASYLEARTRRLLAEESLARERALYKDGIVAKRRFLETQARHQEARTTEQRHRQSLLLSGMEEVQIQTLARQQELSATLDVVSPLEGVVLEQIATAGQRVAAAEPLYRIGHLSPLWIEVHVPLDELKATEPGSLVRIPAYGIEGEVITVGRMVHGTDQGVLVRAELRTGVERLRPGQFVEARVSGATGAGSVRVPAQAVVRHAGQDLVFVERPEGFEAVTVEVASREPDQVVIGRGLAPGDRVVVDGTAAVKAAWLGGHP